MLRLITLGLIFLTTFSIVAQTGGPYDLSHNVVASGGGSNSTGGSYTVDGTVGQAAAGVQSSGSTLSIRGGFWYFQSFAPTAAGTSISGQVRTSDEYGIRNVTLTLTNVRTGESHLALSSAFGYYRFDDVPVGEFYQLQIRSKRYFFKPDVRFINLVDELTEVDFVALPVPAN